MYTKGFTLVELSIVLVVIGLLIGGILTGQSLISSAKITSQIKQLQEWDVAVGGFRAKYRGVPGDNQFISPQGDGDRLIESNLAGSNGGDDDVFAQESANFWKQLSEDGNWKVKYSNSASGTGVQAGIHIPKLVMGKNLGAAVGVGYNGEVGVPFNQQNFYYLGSFQASACCSWGATTAFSPVDALAIDTKADDGIANVGSVKATGGTGGDLSTNPTSTVGTGCLVNGDLTKYQITSTNDTACSIAVKMFAQTTRE